MKIKPLNIVSSSVFFCGSLAYGQIYYETSDRPVTLYVVADATFNARQMPIPFNVAYTISGDGTITSTSVGNAAITDAYTAYLGKIAPAIAASSGYAPAIKLTSFFADYSVYFTYFTVASIAIQAYQEFVVSDHTKNVLYQFICPTDGYYDITYWVPGDWDKPASDVYVTSYAQDGVYAQTLFSQDAVSNKTLTNHVYLRKGLNLVSIDVGSGTVLTHNAGHLISVNLNDSTLRTWTVQGFPVNVMQYQLSSIISPTIGGLQSTTVPYQPPSNPLSISDGLPTTYSNPGVVAYLPPNPPEMTSIRGPVNGDNSTTYYTQPDATVSSVFQNGSGVFTTTRLNDYTYTITIHCLRAPTE
jgi:hypothetical protein